MFFFKSKLTKNSKRTAVRKVANKPVDDRAKILAMIRKIRARISPEVLMAAERVAFDQIGVELPRPSENDASRLFKMAMADNGARRAEILALVERRVNKQLH